MCPPKGEADRANHVCRGCRHSGHDIHNACKKGTSGVGTPHHAIHGCLPCFGATIGFLVCQPAASRTKRSASRMQHHALMQGASNLHSARQTCNVEASSVADSSARRCCRSASFCCRSFIVVPWEASFPCSSCTVAANASAVTCR